MSQEQPIALALAAPMDVSDSVVPPAATNVSPAPLTLPHLTRRMAGTRVQALRQRGRGFTCGGLHRCSKLQVDDWAQAIIRTWKLAWDTTACRREDDDDGRSIRGPFLPQPAEPHAGLSINA